MRKTNWLILAAVLLMLTMSMSMSAAHAESGAGVGANPIVLTEIAHPGHRYSLPSLYVINPGTDPSAYRIGMQLLGRNQSRSVPATWLQFGHDDIVLNPQQSTSVALTLVVPHDAPPGTYLSLIVASTAPSGNVGGTTLGAAAATELRFSVARVDHPLVTVGLLWKTPWRYVWVGIATMIAVAFAVRRSGVRLVVQRPRDH